MDDEVFVIAANIRDGEGIVVSDGSFKEGRGTAALVIEGSNGSVRIAADVSVPGHSSYQCAFRSEAAGILASMQMVQAVVQYTKITHGKIKMCCDGKSALSRCFSKSVDMSKPHWDIVNMAIQERAASVVSWVPQHVKGHQETFPLERDATLNEERDHRCKDFWSSSQSTTPIWFRASWVVCIALRDYQGHPVLA
jgi:hypothetical protein